MISCCRLRRRSIPSIYDPESVELDAYPVLWEPVLACLVATAPRVAKADNLELAAPTGGEAPGPHGGQPHVRPAAPAGLVGGLVGWFHWLTCTKNTSHVYTRHAVGSIMIHGDMGGMRGIVSIPHFQKFSTEPGKPPSWAAACSTWRGASGSSWRAGPCAASSSASTTRVAWPTRCSMRGMTTTTISSPEADAHAFDLGVFRGKGGGYMSVVNAWLGGCRGRREGNRMCMRVWWTELVELEAVADDLKRARTECIDLLSQAIEGAAQQRNEPMEDEETKAITKKTRSD